MMSQEVRRSYPYLKKIEFKLKAGIIEYATETPTIVVDFETVLEMVEVVEVVLVRVGRVLEGDEVLAGEGLVGQQVLPVLCLQVQFLDGLNDIKIR